MGSHISHLVKIETLRPPFGKDGEDNLWFFPVMFNF